MDFGGELLKRVCGWQGYHSYRYVCFVLCFWYAFVDWLNVFEAIQHVHVEQIHYWKYFSPWLYSISSLTLGIVGLLCACLGGKSTFIYMLLNFLVFGLVIEPIVMGAQECQGSCEACAPACPACCKDNSCGCDYIQFLFFSFGALMQIGSIFVGCSLIPSADSRWDDSRIRTGDEGTPYLRFETPGYPGSTLHGIAKALQLRKSQACDLDLALEQAEERRRARNRKIAPAPPPLRQPSTPTSPPDASGWRRRRDPQPAGFSGDLTTSQSQVLERAARPPRRRAHISEPAAQR